MIGKTVKAIVDRPMGSCHPKYKDTIYKLNYGYIPGIFSPDGEEQDVYILGVDVPITEFIGKVIAVIHRLDDVEQKLVVAPEGISFTEAEIYDQVSFIERFFKTKIII